MMEKTVIKLFLWENQQVPIHKVPQAWIEPIRIYWGDFILCTVRFVELFWGNLEIGFQLFLFFMVEWF